MKGLTSRARKRLLDFFEEGVPISQIHGCFSAEVDGFDNLRFTVKDLAHEVYKARRLKMLGGDSRTLMTYMKKMQEGNDNFFHSIRLDPEGRLKDVIWVDGRSRAAYEEFGDVVCFDATYLTNKWIFQEWLLAMNNKAPAAILTDQAAAMRKPLEEFENDWTKFITDNNLNDNEWLSTLYSERHMWVPAYLRDYFWAGMKTTQRVESINSFFDGYVNLKTKLFEFPIKYAKAMHKRVCDETTADANCAKYVRRLVTGFKVEKFFQRMYTDTKFQEVQNECTRMMYCYCKESKIIDGNIIEYDVEDRVWIVPEGKSEEVITDRRRVFKATFNKDNLEVECQCRKFVTHGIMCKHMIQILDKNQVVEVPEQYVLRRWRKDILRKHKRVAVSYHNPNKYAAVKRYNKLMTEFEEICDVAAMVDEEAVSLVRNALLNIRSQVLQCRQKKAAESITLSLPDDGTDQNMET
ncbi:protein FAR-RED IMPAIRED RESPONSE 1-like [Chenopodium quinoa]|uniref:protein FAR-RED IMPAIRED RESPONSE 1-like n=1 Tax=Chenopodium quinoa TaxID=63459 RepID=UPI000B776442|nr:protein FAR-RED IMPAIRED RESPONSE 1-like [Chenopodium quinoa]